MHVCVLHTHASSTSRLRPIWFVWWRLVQRPSGSGPAVVPPHLHINPRCEALCQKQYRPTLVATSQTTQAHTPLSLFYCPWNGACSKYYLPLCFIPPFIPKSAGRRKEPWGWVTFSSLFSSLQTTRQRQRLPGDERFCLLCDRCGFRQILLWWGNARLDEEAQWERRTASASIC